MAAKTPDRLQADLDKIYEKTIAKGHAIDVERISIPDGYHDGAVVALTSPRPAAAPAAWQYWPRSAAPPSLFTRDEARQHLASSSNLLKF